MARPRKNAARTQDSLLTPDNVVEIPVEEQLYPLPEGWKWVRLGDITEIVGGGTPPSRVKEYYENGDIPWLSPADLSDYHEIYISRGKKMLTATGLKNSSARMMPAETVCLSSRAPIGYVVIAKNPLCTNQGFKSFLPSHLYIPNFLYWYLKGNKQLLESYASGTTFLELSGSKVARIEFPLPPIDEQQRIVDRIESLFSKLDEAKTKAEAVLDGFESRKAAILHKALTGELTEKWREEKGFSFDSWEKICLGKILKVSSGKGLTSKNMDNSGKIPVYGGNGITGYHNQSNVVKNTIVIGRVGYYCGSVHYIKKKAWVTDNALIVSFDRNKFESNFLFYLLLHTDLRQNDSSTAQPVISGSKIYPIEITITTNILEQQKIVRILDSLFAKEQQVKEAAESVLNQIELMKKAILTKAFRGELTRHIHN